MQVPQRRQRLSLNTGKRFSSSSMAPNGHSTVQRLHWVQPSRRTIGYDRSPERGCAARPSRGILDRLDRLQRGAGGVLGRLRDVHRPAHRAGGVDAGAAGLVGEADEVRVGEAVLQLRQVLALAVVEVEDRHRLRLRSAIVVGADRCSTPEFGTWPVASTTRSACDGGVLVEDQVAEIHRARVAAGSTPVTLPLVNVTPLSCALR